MQPRGIISYIRTEEAINTPKEKIVEHLLLAGYAQADIDEAFRELRRDPGMEKAGIFADLVPSRRPESHFFGWLVAFIAFNMVLFVVFSFLYNSITPISGYDETLPANSAAPTIPVQAPVQNPVNTVSTPSPNPIPAASPVQAASTNSDISPSDRDQIIAAIITQGTIFTSGNAANIRNYLEITASATYKQQLDAMSDGDILSLASTMTAGESYVTADALNSAQAVWQRMSAASVQVTVSTPGGSVVRTSNEAKGVWY